MQEVATDRRSRKPPRVYGHYRGGCHPVWAKIPRVRKDGRIPRRAPVPKRRRRTVTGRTMRDFVAPGELRAEKVGGMIEERQELALSEGNPLDQSPDRSGKFFPPRVPQLPCPVFSEGPYHE